MVSSKLVTNAAQPLARGTNGNISFSLHDLLLSSDIIMATAGGPLLRPQNQGQQDVVLFPVQEQEGTHSRILSIIDEALSILDDDSTSTSCGEDKNGDDETTYLGDNVKKARQ